MLQMVSCAIEGFCSWTAHGTFKLAKIRGGGWVGGDSKCNFVELPMNVRI